MEHELITRMEEAHSRDPRQNPYGYFSYNDGPAPFGGGIGGFTWFASEPDAARFVVEVDLPSNSAFRAGDDLDVAALIPAKTLLAAVLTERRSFVDVIPALNAMLQGITQIEWAGSFTSLCSGDGAFEQKVRRGYHEQFEDSDDSEDASVILASDHDAFVDYLSTFGT